MPIPSFDKLLRPILDLASRQAITRKIAAQEMIQLFRLTQEEIESRIPTGSATYIQNRAGWAMTFLTKGKLIHKIAKATYEATEFGKEFLLKHPSEITVSDLKKISGWEDSWKTTKSSSLATIPEISSVPSSENATPFEIIDSEILSLRSDLRDRLLQTILDQPFDFFEQLVLDVLIAMGYGGAREEASLHVGRTGDEGIDGRINQDVLGLDQICIQAKRYRPDNVIGRPAIQAFVGSLSGQGINKGIFITTSRFAATAEEFVMRGSPTKIILIDGAMLIDLMVRHNIGVRVSHRYEVHEIDQNYFDENE